MRNTAIFFTRPHYVIEPVISISPDCNIVRTYSKCLLRTRGRPSGSSLDIYRRSAIPPNYIYIHGAEALEEPFLKLSIGATPIISGTVYQNVSAKELFPNIKVFLQIACTLPVTSCECERNASALRRLNSYMRASMGKGRLSNLVLLHIHYDTDINRNSVVDCYARLHPHRL